MRDVCFVSWRNRRRRPPERSSGKHGPHPCCRPHRQVSPV